MDFFQPNLVVQVQGPKPEVDGVSEKLRFSALHEAHKKKKTSNVGMFEFSIV